ncbi:protein SUPPRESSOR OF npr1-1, CONSTITUTIVE [Salix suchowensis]|nr:protein SUPPRESSOR OF npr1-1, CONSTITUTIVE [Salix suchowensis]
MASSTPPTLTNAQTQGKFDVFLSFRGDDTRAGFTSHLHAALKGKQILTFIDYQLVRGEEISASLLRTIEESKLSVVDPSHVRNQTGSFGDEFARLVEKKPLTMDKVQSFKNALTNAANLAGWSLGKSELESEFIEKIVGDVLNKLHGMSSSHTTGLFGIDDRVNKVESLLNMESQDVLIVGYGEWVGNELQITQADLYLSEVLLRSDREEIVIGYRAANAERAVINPPAKTERRRWSLKDVFVVTAEKE